MGAVRQVHWHTMTPFDVDHLVATQQQHYVRPIWSPDCLLRQRLPYAAKRRRLFLFFLLFKLVGT